MAATVLADTGFLVALLTQRDARHAWAKVQAERHPIPWHTCEAVLTEAFHLLASSGGAELGELVHRQALRISFSLSENVKPVFTLMQRYRERPMSLADACLVRMTELFPDPVVLTTDADFRVYRRHGRQVVPALIPD